MSRANNGSFDYYYHLVERKRILVAVTHTLAAINIQQKTVYIYIYIYPLDFGFFPQNVSRVDDL